MHVQDQERDSGGQDDQRQTALSVGWQVLVMILLSVAFATIASLLVLILGLADNLNAVAPGVISAVIVVSIMVSVTAPTSTKQLVLIAMVAAAGGTLAILTVLAVRLFAGGWWGDILGVALASVLGGGFILLCYRLLKVTCRQPPLDDPR